MADSLLIRVAADVSDVKRSLDVAEGHVAKFGRATSKVGTLMKTAFAAVAVGAVGVVAKEMFQLGAAVEETASKFNTVMGPATARMSAFIDDYGIKLGLTTREAQDLLATTAAMGQGFGYSQQAAADMAAEVVTLAGDLSSFNNLPTEDVLARVTAAMAGERESLKRLGIVIRETDVQQAAMAMSGKDNAAALTQQEKAAATLELVSLRAGVAVGDLARTQDSSANTARRVTARFRELKEQLATAFMPAFAMVLGAVDGSSGIWKGLNALITWTAKLVIHVAAGMQLFANDAKRLGSELVLLKNIMKAIVSSEYSIADARREYRSREAELFVEANAIAQARDAALELLEATNEGTDAVQATVTATTTLRTETEETATAARRFADAMAEAASASNATTGFGVAGAPASSDPAVAGLRSANTLNIGKIPEQMKALFAATKEAGDETERMAAIWGDTEAGAVALAEASGVLETKLGGLAASIMGGGGLVGGVVAVVGAFVSRSQRRSQLIRAAAATLKSSIDAYVSVLVDPATQIQNRAVEGAREILKNFYKQWFAEGNANPGLEPGQMEAIDKFDMSRIIEELAKFGEAGQQVIEALKKKWADAKRAAEEAGKAAEEAAKAAADAAAAAAEALRANVADVFADFTARDLALKGDDRGALSARLTSAAQKEVAALQELVDAGGLSEAAFLRLVTIINGEVLGALADFDVAAREAAEAAREAARAEQFRAQMDLENLRIRLLTVRGMDREALALRQKLELLTAIEEQRSAEYIAILETIHAEELKNFAAQKAADAARDAERAMAAQANATERAARAADGLSRVLNGPAGFTFALTRNRVLREQGAAGSPGGIGSSSNSVNVEAGAIVVNAAAGQDPGEIAQRVLDGVGVLIDDRLRAGGVNPFTITSEGF